MRAARPILALYFCTAVAAACAGGGQGGAGAGPAPSTAPPGGQAAGTTPSASQTWPIRTREHVDLWLHGFAMVQADTARVPLFRRGYRDEIGRSRGGVTTLLDTNRDQLSRRFALNRDLVGAQFLALYAESWDDLRQAAQLFLQANGDPNRAGSQQAANIIATFAQSFPTSADRDWLATFLRSLEDEQTKFYHNYWVQQQRARGGALTAIDTLWQGRYRPRIQRFLNNTQQANGEFVLSLPLNGEGRTVSGGKQQNLITVGFPASAAEAPEAIYVFAHEAVGVLVATTVNDNTSPADRRSGLTERLQSAGTVRGGHMLLQRVAPELADGYARYYLRSAGVAAGSNAGAALAATFPVPDAIRDAIGRQLDVVLGGI